MTEVCGSTSLQLSVWKTTFSKYFFKFSDKDIEMLQDINSLVEEEVSHAKFGLSILYCPQLCYTLGVVIKIFTLTWTGWPKVSSQYDLGWESQRPVQFVEGACGGQLFLTGPTVLLIAFWPQVTKNVQGFLANNQCKGHMLYTSAMLMMGL